MVSRTRRTSMMSTPIETIMDDSETENAGFYWRERDGVRALICAPLEQDGFTNAFSTRGGGVSPMPQDALNLAGFNEDDAENIYENRRRFLKLCTEVINVFKERFPESEKLFVPTRDGHARVDLQQANRDQLISAGVAADRIYTAPLCTMDRTDLFFSYRREKRLHGRVGRLMSV